MFCEWRFQQSVIPAKINFAPVELKFRANGWSPSQQAVCSAHLKPISFVNISPTAFNILLTISGATAGQGGNISDAVNGNSFIWASTEL